uniref:UDP-glucosyltransferase 74AH1 n=1 Tax=Centella asiatica TaxID=48106 RepID=A0A2I7M6E6_CENAS|nr:UDP-glucosyltransferase 74AH1 [Centella asiatica]
MEAKQPHIMLIAYPAQGHINPLLQFAKRLASKNLLQVTLVADDATVTTSSFSTQGQTNSLNIEYISYGFDMQLGVLNLSNPDQFIAHHKLRVSQNLPKLINKHKYSGHPVQVLVYDSVMPWVLDIAKELGLKGAPFFTQSCAVCAIYFHMLQGMLNIPEAMTSLVSIPSLPLLDARDLPSLVYDMGSYPSILDVVLDQFSNLEKTDWILFNNFDALEDKVAEWLSNQQPIKTVGPCIPSMFLDKRLAGDKDYGLSLFKPDVEACIKWLDAKDAASVVYVSFGSMANLGLDQMEELAWGLLNSNSFFLWVVRESEQSKLPKKFMSEAAKKGLVVSWCPQLQVLAHKAVGSFMTHCGWNSTLEALCLGVPMLAMPQWTDQTTNAKYIVDVWQTGIRVKAIDNESVTKEDVAKCVKDVMEGTTGKALRANAIRWKELAVEAMSEGGSSDKNIDEFISEIKLTSTC